MSVTASLPAEIMQVEPHTAHSIRARSQGLEQRTAVRDDRHAAGSPFESGEKRQLVAAVDVEVADAVWPDNGKVPTRGGPLQALLKSRPFASHLGEPARHDDETARAGVRHLLGQRHGPGGRQQAEHGVHGSSDVGEAGVRVSTEHRLVLGVHDVGVHLAVEDRRDGLGEGRGVGRAHDRHGPGLQEPGQGRPGDPRGGRRVVVAQ